MPLRITEYGGFQSGRPFSPIVPVQPALRTQLSTAASGGGASTLTLSSGTRFVQIGADAAAGGSGYYVIFTSSVSTVAASSTNALYVAANTSPISFFVQPYMRCVALSS